jgi:hypothetical protein
VQILKDLYLNITILHTPQNFGELEWFAAIAKGYQKRKIGSDPDGTNAPQLKAGYLQKEYTPMQTLGPEKVRGIVG